MNMGSYSCCLPSSFRSKKLNDLSTLLKIVSEQNRLKLISILESGEHCVCEMTDHVKLSQSLISHHLKDLKDAGLVKDDKRGLKVYYSLSDKGKQIVNILFQIPSKEVKSK